MLTIPSYLTAAMAQGPVQFVPRVEWSPDRQTWYPLRPLSGSHTQDRTSQTRWTFTGSFARDYVVGPESGQIHPYGGRVRIDMGITTYRNSTYWVPAGRYIITQAETADDNISISLTGASYETDVIDSTFAVARNLPDQGYSDIRSQTERLITEAVPDAVYYWDPSLLAASPFPALTLDAGSGRWDFIDGDASSESLMGVLGAEASCDAAGYFQFRPIPTLTQTPIASIPYAGAQISPAMTYDRSNVNNFVSVSGESPDGQTTIGPVYAWDDDPSSATYAGADPVNHPGVGVGPFGLKPVQYSNPMLTTPYQAMLAAPAQLANYLGFGYSITVSTYYSPAWEAGNVILFERAAGYFEPHVLDTIEYDWGTATATITSRTPKET
jgi:hypothetical protein